MHSNVPRLSPRLALVVGLVAAALALPSLQAAFADGHGAHAAGETLYDFEARRLGGDVESLAAYRGQVVLVVNTASRCGYTPQYEELQALYLEQHERGLTVLGFPSNDFGQQEPGSDAQIGAFCKKNYGVEFPMFSKVKVNGPEAHPLYAWLTSQPEPVGGPVQWNFQKYLVDRDGRVVQRYASSVKPSSRELRAEIDRLLAQPAS